MDRFHGTYAQDGRIRLDITLLKASTAIAAPSAISRR
jgi:hypothetical protein